MEVVEEETEGRERRGGRWSGERMGQGRRETMKQMKTTECIGSN